MNSLRLNVLIQCWTYVRVKQCVFIFHPVESSVSGEDYGVTPSYRFSSQRYVQPCVCVFLLTISLASSTHHQINTHDFYSPGFSLKIKDLMSTQHRSAVLRVIAHKYAKRGKKTGIKSISVCSTQLALNTETANTS